MGVLLPAFVDQLLEQGRDPGGIPDIPVAAATGWLAPLTSRILSVLDTGTYRSAGAFLAHGYTYLPVLAKADCGVYLRVAAKSSMSPWPVDAPSVVLVVAGTTAMEMYQEPDDLRGGRPQYARSFGAEQVFAVYPGALCATQSSDDGLQILATNRPPADADEALSGDEFAAAARRARWMLESVGSMPAGGRC
ncbi:hypothetical protein AB0436_21545 [Streptomyces sp. NPDC051322]|uniref:hypothetical protein n=1 Tax=Streptomyces sp. NPDC051322 TaxID=3154645 RepID=UPI00344C9473